MSNELIGIVAVIVIVIVLFLLERLVSAIRSNENLSEYVKVMGMLDDTIADTIIYVAFGDVDLSAYEVKAREWEDKNGRWIDPRMWFVLDKAEIYAKDNGLEIEFDDLLVRAESIYQTLRRDPNNGLDLNPND